MKKSKITPLRNKFGINNIGREIREGRENI